MDEIVWVKNASRSVTSPADQTQGRQVPIQLLNIVDIPGAMDKMGWKVAPKLMRRWLRAPGWEMPEIVKTDKTDAKTLAASQVDIGTVTMAWALSYPQVKKAYDELLITWKTPKAIDRLKMRLQNAGWQGGPFHLGDLSQPATLVDSSSQINFHRFGNSLDIVDDLKGGLAGAQLKLAVSGRVARNWLEQDCFLVEELGVYIHDTYEFIDNEDALISQPLGIWSKDRCLSKTEMAVWSTSLPPVRAALFPGFYWVDNSDFNRYRKKRGLGGDFVVYSDVRKIKLLNLIEIKL